MGRHYLKTFTVSVASPAVFTCTDHGLYRGDKVAFTTSDTLPTGLTATTGSSETVYYVTKHGLTTSTFEVSRYRYMNDNGPSVNTSGSQSGTHQFYKVNDDNLRPKIEDTR